MAAIAYLAAWAAFFALSAIALGGVHGCSDLPSPNGSIYVALSRGPALPVPAVQGCYASAAPLFIVLALAYAALTALWLRLQHTHISTGVIVLLAVPAAILAIVFPYVSTSDAYAYALYAYEMGVLHLSPYAAHAIPVTDTGATFAQLFPDARADIRVMNYGPVFAAAYAAIGAICGSSVKALIYGERVFSELCIIATALLISRARAVVLPRQALVLVLLSPLLLVEGVCFAHADAFMLALLCAAWLCWERDRPLEAGAFIGLAIGVRSVALFALIAAAYCAYRGGRSQLVPVLGGALGTIALCAAASYAVFGTVSFGGGAAIDPFGSPAAVVVNLIGGVNFSHTVIATGVQFAIGMTLIAAALLAASYDYIALGALASAPALRPWYVQWLVPVLALPASLTAKRVMFVVVALAVLGEAPLMTGGSKVLAIGVVALQWAIPITLAALSWKSRQAQQD